NCSYWHGAFGGVYIPHLRHAVYHGLITAERTILPAEVKQGQRVTAEERDFNLDTRTEVRLANNHLAAYFTPARGGSLYELDLWHIGLNAAGGLSRCPELYHQAILDSVNGKTTGPQVSQVQEQAKFKQEGLDRLLYYDRYLRKSLVDHFYGMD